MDVLLMVVGSGVVLLAAYLTIGRWLSRRAFGLDDARATPAVELSDGADYVPTKKSILFGHHFASIAGGGAIVGPALAVMWGWLPALVWVVLGSIFVGAVHDMGAIVVSMREKGRSIGDIAGDVVGPRARFIFLAIAVVCLWLMLAMFGMVIANVLQQYPSAIFPVMAQIPIAVALGWVIRRARGGIAIPSIVALVLMSASVVWGDVGVLHTFNAWMASGPIWAWVAGLLVYAAISSLLPVWRLNQPRGYINGVLAATVMALLVVGLGVATIRYGGTASPAPSTLAGEGGERVGGSESGGGYSPSLSLVAPMINWNPGGAPPMFPFLFIMVATGACSGFHALVGSGTTSKQIARERDSKGVGFGAMMTHGFLAVLVIAACAGGIGLGVFSELQYGATLASGNKIYGINTVDLGMNSEGKDHLVVTAFLEADPASAPWLPNPVRSDRDLLQTFLYELGEGDLRSYGTTSVQDPTVEQVLDSSEVTTTREGLEVEVEPAVILPDAQGHQWYAVDGGAFRVTRDGNQLQLVGDRAFSSKYIDWRVSNALEETVGAFVEGGANFLTAFNIPRNVAMTMLAVIVASFAATTMETACRLQRYLLQGIARGRVVGRRGRHSDRCPSCGYDMGGLADTGTSDSTKTCPECGRHSTALDRANETVVVRLAIARASWWNPWKWLATAPGAAMVAVITAAALASIPMYNQPWSLANAGYGAAILWPVFAAVNQVLAGFTFVVIIAWVRMMGRPWWFAIVPAVLMLIAPACVLVEQMFIGNGIYASWLAEGKWVVLGTGCVVLALEVWMVGEAMVRWPRGKVGTGVIGVS